MLSISHHPLPAGQQTLAREEHFLRAVVDSTVDALVAFDLQGQFVLCNRSFEELCGLSAVELNGHDEAWLRRRLADSLTAPLSFSASTPAGAASAGSSSDSSPSAADETYEAIVELKDGVAKPRILRWYSGPVRDERDALVGHVAVLRDITTETEVDQMKTDFISIVSHELRTPLTSIKGYVDLVLDGDTGEINHLQREFLSTVQRNTLRLVAMINDMLDISRMESGAIELDVRPLSLPEVIEQAVEKFEAKEAKAEGAA